MMVEQLISTDERVKVLVAAGSSTSLNALISMVEADGSFEVVASAMDGEECLRKIGEQQVDVLLAELDLPKISGVKITEYLSLEHPRVASIILADQNGLGFFRTAMLAGAMDFLTTPVPAEELACSIKRVHQLNGERLSRSSGLERLSPEGKVLLGKNGKTVTICGGKGGTGKSTVASFLALCLQSSEDICVGLVDFDLQFGNLGVLFDARSNKSLIDLLPIIDELDSVVLKTISNSVTPALDLYSCPVRVEKGELINRSHILRIVEVLKETYEVIVFDTGPRLSEVHLDLFELSDLLLVIVDQDLSSIKTAAQLKNVYDRLGLPSESIALVLNKYNQQRAIDVERISESVGTDVIAMLPSLSKGTIEALDFGVTSLEMLTDAELTTFSLLAGAVRERLGIPCEAQPTRAERRPVWARFLRG